jgi:hypothetical protein
MEFFKYKLYVDVLIGHGSGSGFAFEIRANPALLGFHISDVSFCLFF